MPDNYLAYLPGEELFTLVRPGNKVVVLQADWFTERSEEKIKIKITSKRRVVGKCCSIESHT